MGEVSGILVPVLVVAVMAVIVRIVLKRSQVGVSGVRWERLVYIFVVALAYVVSFMLIDPYRIDILQEGAASANECRQGYVIGRPAGDGVTVASSLDNLPLFFALKADSVAPSGYWMLKDEAKVAESVVRESMHHEQDESRVAIRHKTNTFAVTRHPADLSLYVPVFRLALSSGQKVLAAMPDYDAHSSVTPIGTLRPLGGLLLNVAERDSLVNSQVFMLCYDASRMRPDGLSYVIYKVAGALICAAVFALLFRLVFRPLAARFGK